MRYRREIDGLRAVAVIPVVLFHAGVAGLSGGFVGVDVFFVISGFLITSIIHEEMRREQFSAAAFYERRVRRILPNLLVMIAVTAIGAAILLIPTDLKQFGASAIAAVAAVSNIYFWEKTGYFAPNSGQLPLLHTWSLGVEEQYYFAFPPLLAFLIRHWRRRTGAVIWLLFFASLIVSVVQVRLSPDAAFYLPFARLWELMLGSLLAIGAVPPLRQAVACELAAVAGLLMILAALVTFNSGTPFPGAAALVPCLGAAVLIHANGCRLTLIGRFLSSKAAVFVGTISYSLYLWHWPAIVLTRYALQRDLTPVETVVLLVGVVAVSIAAWRFIEQPMRHTRAWPRLRLFAVVCSASAAVAALGLVFWAGRGLPGRLPPLSRAYAAGSLDTNPARAACDSPSLRRLDAGQVCRLGAPGVEPSFALIGDSYGDALAPAVALAAQETGVAGLSLTRGGCMPLAGVGQRGSPCRQAEDAAYKLVANSPSIRTVILIARWPGFISGARFGLWKDAAIYSIDDLSLKKSFEENVRVTARGLTRSMSLLGSRRVYVVTGLPEQLVDVPQAASLRVRFGGDLRGLDRGLLDRRQAATRAFFARLQPRLGYSVLDAEPHLCAGGWCPIVDGSHALYADDNHVSRYGAERIRSIFYPALTPSPPPLTSKIVDLH